jgi:hypothetical protein
MIPLLLFPLIFVACASPAQVSKTQSAPQPCAFTFGSKTLSWTKMDNIEALGLKKQIGKTTLPPKFEAFSIDEKELNAFLKAAKAGSTDARKMSFPLPLATGCITFSITPSGILSDSLALRFPELISLKGVAINNQRITARIDYSKATKLKAALTTGNQVYLISAWPGTSGYYYLLYKKEDAGYEKIPYQHY